MRIEGATALVTGAAGGLGEAISRALAARGARLLLSGRRAEPLETLAAQLGGEALVCDLADRADLASLPERAGRVDVLVANAALPADGQIEEYSEEQIDRALDVNLRAPILLARLLAGPMVERGSGHLVFMSSLSGKAATSGSALYSATKFGLRGFASSLRQDLWDKGVGVSTIFPGPIADAGMFAQTQVTLPRLAGAPRTPGDVAGAVVRAIERNRGEIDVATAPLRLGSALSCVAPSAAAAVNRRVGAADIAAQIAGSEAHRSRR